MSRFIHLFAAQGELEIGFYLRIEVFIQVHGDTILTPLEREQMEITLNRIVRRIELPVVRVCAVVERLAPMAGTVEIAVLRTGLDTVMMAHLADIDLAAFGPNDPSFGSQLRGTCIDIVVIA